MALRQWAVNLNGTFDFNNPADWMFGVVPGAADIAQFNTGATDTVTGNATIAEILVGQGSYTFTGSYTISGAQTTELSFTSSGPFSYLTIAPGAFINGNGAVSVTFPGANPTLEIQGALAASSLTINEGVVYVDQGSVFDISGSIAISNNGALISRPGPGQPPGAPIVIANPIQISGSVNLSSARKQEIDFNSTISGSGSVAVTTDDTFGPGGTVALNGNNTYSGGTLLLASNETLAVGNPSALGTGSLTIAAGELLATTTETIANQLTMSGNFTIAAAHNQTLTTSSSQAWSLTPSTGEIISFGAAGQDGTVVFDETGGATVGSGGFYTVAAQAGTLKAGDYGLDFLLGIDTATIVQSGATLDAAGFHLDVNGLQGGGRVTNSSATVVTLDVSGSGNFSGVIDGALALLVSGLLTTLSGADAYTGGTTISSGSTLILGNNGTTGSVTGSITDNGILAINRSDSFTLNNVSGPGKVVQEGSGTTSLGKGLSYSGGTTIAAGTLAVGSPAGLGAGGLTIGAGELLATATETIANQLTMSGNFTIAAAHNQTLTTSSLQPWSLYEPFSAIISFGATGQDGTVVFDATGGSSINGVYIYKVAVQAGTLKAGDFGLDSLLGNDAATIVQSGATLDAAGFSLTVNRL